MELQIADGKFLIGAPSTDDRLSAIPGYGWQPTPRAWEFPCHDGIVALARRVLGSEISIPEHLDARAALWEAKVEDFDDSVTLPFRIENNRYVVDHDPDLNNRAELIPSCQITMSGSEFLIHPAVNDLISKLFRGEVSHASDSADEDQSSSRASDRNILQESEVESGVGETSAFEDPILLHKHTSIEPWIGQAIKILQAAASGTHPSDRYLEAVSENPIDDCLLQLAALIASQEAESARRNSCSELISKLTWGERYYLLFELLFTPLDYIGSEHVDDVSLIKHCVGQLIGVQKFEDLAGVIDILDVCSTDLAYRRAMDAYLDDRLLENQLNTLTTDAQTFLKGILDWFSNRIDETALNLAFDEYGRFLNQLARPEDLDELIDVCSIVGDRRALKSKSCLLTAHAIHAMPAPDGGVDKAIEFLVETQHSLPPDYDDREYICSEARILAGENSELAALLGDCASISMESEPEESRVQGSLLVIGGSQRLKRIGLRALKSRFPNVDVSWLHIDEAKADRIRTTIRNSDRKIVLYTWVMSHSIEDAARSAASSVQASWDRVRLPGISDVIRVASILLAVKK